MEDVNNFVGRLNQLEKNFADFQNNILASFVDLQNRVNQKDTTPDVIYSRIKNLEEKVAEAISWLQIVTSSIKSIRGIQEKMIALKSKSWVEKLFRQ